MVCLSVGAILGSIKAKNKNQVDCMRLLTAGKTSSVTPTIVVSIIPGCIKRSENEYLWAEGTSMKTNFKKNQSMRMNIQCSG